MAEDHLPTTIHLSCDPVAAQQITRFLTKHLAVCEAPDCKNTVVKDEDYRCFYCSDICTNKYFCLAVHMQHVDLVQRYSFDFQQELWLPPDGYLCNTCLAMLDAEYSLHSEDALALLQSKDNEIIEKILGWQHLAN